MTIANDGGSAFPWAGSDPDGSEGMTLRDYFAAQALIACMASDRWVSGLDKAAMKDGVKFADAVASIVYQMADAMLKARVK